MPTVCCLMSSLLLWGELDMLSLITLASSIWGLAMNWASIQCRVESQSMLSWLSMWKTNAMPIKKNLNWWTVFRHRLVHMVCLRERDSSSIAYSVSRKGISPILTFLREFEIVTTGSAIVEFQSQLLIMKGMRFAQVISWRLLSRSVTGGKISPELKQLGIGYVTLLPLWCGI